MAVGLRKRAAGLRWVDGVLVDALAGRGSVVLLSSEAAADNWARVSRRYGLAPPGWPTCGWPERARWPATTRLCRHRSSKRSRRGSA